MFSFVVSRLHTIVSFYNLNTKHLISGAAAGVAGGAAGGSPGRGAAPTEVTGATGWTPGVPRSSTATTRCGAHHNSTLCLLCVSFCLQSHIQHESFPESFVHPAQAIQVQFLLCTLRLFFSLPDPLVLTLRQSLWCPLQVGLLRQLLQQEPQREQETRPEAEPQLQELGATVPVSRLAPPSSTPSLPVDSLAVSQFRVCVLRSAHWKDGSCHNAV